MGVAAAACMLPNAMLLRVGLGTHGAHHPLGSHSVRDYLSMRLLLLLVGKDIKHGSLHACVLQPCLGVHRDLKLVLVGDAGVGKTALVARIIDDKFDSVTEATIGASFAMKEWRGVHVAVWVCIYVCVMHCWDFARLLRDSSQPALTVQARNV